MADSQRGAGIISAGPAELRPLKIEANGINVITDAERKGRPRDLFWPWFAANVSVLGLSLLFNLLAACWAVCGSCDGVSPGMSTAFV